MTPSEYLIEGILSKRTGLYNVFPERPDRNKLIKFLEGKEFKYIDSRKPNYGTGKVYELGNENPKEPQTFWIKFYDTETNRNEFLKFFCRFDNLNRATWSDFMVNSRTIDTFDEFREKVCEYFGWK